jgi:hypothetical protein
MWLFTTFGFFSVVQKRSETVLTVRARVASDLDRLRTAYMPELSETVLGAGTDYPARATISHADFSRGLAKIGTDIHYDNFKSEVAKEMGRDRESVYHRVWSTLTELEEP